MSNGETQSVASAGAVNFDAGLVKADVQQQMMAVDAAPERPVAVIGGISAVTAPAVSVEAVVEAPTFNTINVLPFITLSYGSPVIHGMKELRSVTIPQAGDKEESFNFYNPFLKANPAKNTHPGVVRATMNKLFDLMQTVEGREAIFVGPVSDTRANLEAIADNLKKQMERKFPLSPTDEIMTYETDDGPAVLHFGDLCSVHTWVSMAEDEDSGSINVTLNFNLALNSCALYDSDEPHIFIERAITFVRGTLEKMGAEDLNPYIVLAMNSESLQDEPVRDLLALLLSPNIGFALVSRAAVLRGAEDWISPADADKMFVDNTDILLLGRIFSEEEEQEDEQEDTDGE